MKVVNNTFEEPYNKWTQDHSERLIAATPIIIASNQDRLQDLFKQIEVAQVKNLELDYKPLIARLNNEIAITIAKLKARST